MNREEEGEGMATYSGDMEILTKTISALYREVGRSIVEGK